ncbi:hypothetical protein G9A89_006541 [Geosiphon pyriformis]|nr:hypothetical protein G9A89_006541 [Geosiphon pyriformis]
MLIEKLINNPFFVDIEATASSTTPKKKAPKGAFQGSTGDSFSQKKKVVLSNVKHSGNEKNIFLSKAGSSGSVYSDVKSLFGEDEDVNMSGMDVNTGVGFGSMLGFSNFHMDDDKVVLPPHLPISLEKKWIDLKIIKTPVEVLVKKSFALDINLSAVEGKSATAKTQLIRKIFSTVNGFGGITTPSKFKGIIRSTFTSEKSIEMAMSLARENKIIINTNLKKQEVHSDWAVVIKKIPMDMPKDMIVTAVTKFGEIKSIRIQLIGMWQKAVVEFVESSQANLLASKWSFLIRKDSVCVAKAVGDHDVWALRDQFKVLLFTLPVGTTAHDLGTLLEKTGGKTCIINCSLKTGNRFHCAVVGFESNEELEFVFLTELIFSGVHFSWARLDLVWCGKCEHFGHLVLECDVSDLARLYAKKNVSISCPTAFGSKSWAQVVSSASSSGGSPSSSGLFSGGMPLVVSLSNYQVVGLNNCLVVLECSLRILSDQVSVILKKLSFIKLVPLAASFCAPSLAVSVSLAPIVNLNMALNDMLASADPFFSGSSESATVLSSSGSKVLTFKMGGLESKMSALKALFGSILFVFGFFIPMNDLIWKVATCNVHNINIPAKQEDVVHWHFDSGNLISIITETKLRSSIRLWIANKFNVVSSASSSGGSPSSSGLFSGGMPLVVSLSNYQVVGLNNCLVVLECSLRILSDQVSVILKKLSFIKLVPLAASFCAPSLAVSVSLAPIVNLNMALNDMLASADPFFSGSSESATVLSSSGSKVLTFKMGGLESKMSALKALFGSILFVFGFFIPMNDLIWKVATCNVHNINIPAKQEDVVHWHFDSGNLISIITETKLRSSIRLWIANKFNGGFLGAGVAIIMANSLACHVTKIEKILGCVVVAFEVNSVIAKAVNSSCFIILGGDFNKNGSRKSASFKFCLELGLVNLFTGHPLVSNSTWSNSRGVEKTIDFIFVSKILASAVTGHGIGSVSDFFDTDHCAVSVSVGLGSFLDSWLNSLRKQANKDCWKFFIKTVDETKWSQFRDCTSAKLLAVSGEFSETLAYADVNGMLELLVAKVVKGLRLGNLQRVNQLINIWAKLNSGKAAMIANMIQDSSKSSDVLKQLLLFQKEYRKSKMYKLKLAKEASVQKAIECHMEKFCSDKGAMIRNVLDRPFHKVVLNHLVVNDELVLEPGMVKLGVDEIMESWTRKKMVPLVVSNIWAYQYALLDYIRDDAFSGIMCSIDMSELLLVVNNLPDGKAAGLSGIPNELWKHCGNMGGLDGLAGYAQSIQLSWMTLLESELAAYQNVVNRVMIDFGLSNSYVVHDGLDQDEVFSPLLWKIFYNPLLCCIESGGEFSSYFAAGAFNILDIASGFFVLNDIFINNEKTVVILINQSVRVAFLYINSLPILIAKKGETHHYLGIFLSTNGLSKPSLAKAYSDVCFFTNVVLRKAITNKQFLYLVLAVLQPIVNYHTQFSFVLSSSKAGLLRDFSTEALCHPSLYGLKSFEQMQSEGKLAALISFSNSFGVLGCLFEHRFLDLQVLVWSPLNSLQFPVKLCVSPVNNFLAGVIKIFLCNKLSLANNLFNMFHSPGHFSVSSILGGSLFFNSVHSLKQFGVAFGNKLFDKKGCVMSCKTFWCWKRLDPRGPASYWFKVVSEFLCGGSTSMAISVKSVCPFSLSVLDTKEFSVVQDGLHKIWSGFFKVFTNDSVKNYGRANVASGVAAYFFAIDLSVGIRVLRLLSSTMAKLQAIVLALECISSFCSVVLHSNSQTAINACVSEMSLSVSDFCSLYWLERHRIFNLVFKIKRHSGVHGNVKADAAAEDAALS